MRFCAPPSRSLATACQSPAERLHRPAVRIGPFTIRHPVGPRPTPAAAAPRAGSPVASSTATAARVEILLAQAERAQAGRRPDALGQVEDAGRQVVGAERRGEPRGRPGHGRRDARGDVREHGRMGLGVRQVEPAAEDVAQACGAAPCRRWRGPCPPG